MKIHNAAQRGLTETNWLHSRHSFSFAEYYDPNNMGFRCLRVINDDRVQPDSGFGMHGHRDMEIITIVVEGSLQHQDSLGHGEILRPDEVQVMTAGRGIRHSEFNPSHTSAAHFIQIWIEPETMGLEPAYAQKAFSPELRRNNLLRVAGGKQLNDQALHINQDAHVYVTTLAKDATVSFKNVQGRACWIHLIQGECLVNERVLKTGDAASTEGPEIITIQGASTQADIILFDLC